MKIIHIDKRKGIARLKATNRDDLWHLSKIIEKDDIVSAKTERKIKKSRENERSRVKRKKLYATIKVDKINFEVDILRIKGKIAIEKEDLPLNASHTLDVGIGSEVRIEKKWRNYQLARIKDAEAASAAPKIVGCVLDDEQANFAVFTSTEIKPSGKVNLRLAKKGPEKIREKEEFGKIIKELKRLNLEIKPDTIVIASPIFWKEELLKEIKNKDSELAKKIRTETVSTGAKKGLTELINRGALEQTMKSNRIRIESSLIEELLKRIAKQGNVSYGLDETKTAIESGAVEKLLITDKFIRQTKEKNTYGEIEKLIDLAEDSKGEVRIISADHEFGQELQGLGGIAALLRFKI